MIPEPVMRINPTLLEVVLLIIISCSIYVWVKYEKKLVRWWKALWKRHRGPQRLRPREPGV